MREIEKRPSLAKRIASASWRDLVVVGLPTVLVALAAVAVAVKAARFAPPKTIHFAGGPEGSGYRNQAEKYQKILARDGVKIEIIPTRGALDNLDKLANPAVKVDVAFVQGGLAEGRDLPHLMSLGSVYPQPLMVYCRAPEPVEMLPQLKGKRIAVGPEGSGTRVLALKMLKANEMDGPPTTLLELTGDEAAKQLIAGHDRRRVPDG